MSFSGCDYENFDDAESEIRSKSISVIRYSPNSQNSDMRIVPQFFMLDYRFHCASNKATFPSSDDSVTDNVHISYRGRETNGPVVF